MSDAPATIDNKDRRRFEYEEDGHLVFANYRLQGGIHALVHVEADPALRGHGAAGRLMTGIVANARANGLTLAPYCGYARAWFARHPEAGDILAKS